jgi:hypothetical protein
VLLSVRIPRPVQEWNAHDAISETFCSKQNTLFELSWHPGPYHALCRFESLTGSTSVRFRKEVELLICH